MTTGLKGCVLIIDDDAIICAGFKELLEMEGFSVVIQTSPITAPFTIRQVDPDLILLDLSMPGLSGGAFLQAGGRHALRTDAPILLFSGRSKLELARLTEELGADGFVSKQQDTAEIIRHIEMLVDQRRSMRSVWTGERNASAASAHSAAH